MRAILTILALSVAQPAFAADQFDLICTAKKMPVHYRVDLASGEYCAGDCSTVLKLASVTSGVLTLEEHKPAFRGDRESRTEVNRATGNWHTYSFDPKFDVAPLVRDGKCEAQPFSGLPTRRF
jgi:hypothetical protein